MISDNDFGLPEDDLDSAAVYKGENKYAPKGKFDCFSCKGTGKYRGVRVNQEKAHCFNCNGRGWFATAPEKRAEAKVKRAAKKIEREQERKTAAERAVDAWSTEHPGIVERLRQEAPNMGFAQSMLDALMKWGSLTDNQLRATVSMLEKLDAGRAAREAEKAAKSGDIDVSRIHRLFNKALASGLKRPKFRANGLTLSLAPATGRNAGAVYVVTPDDVYLGKVQNGVFSATREATADTLDTLKRITENPLEMAVEYGRLTGNCGCCGRGLTDPESVKRGIGPICAESWGL